MIDRTEWKEMDNLKSVTLRGLLPREAGDHIL